MAELLGIKVLDISLDPIGNSGGRVILNHSYVPMASDL
jgi:hypothetical protein